MHGTWQFFHLTRFWNYISNVIPELGENRSHELSLMDIAKIQLECVIKFEPDKRPLEAEDERWMERVRFKSQWNFGAFGDYIMSMTDWFFTKQTIPMNPFT